MLSGVFGRTYCHHLQGRRISNFLGLLFYAENGGRGYSETPVNFYRTARCHIAVDNSPLCEDVSEPPPYLGRLLAGGSGSILGEDM
jgi:hypothetical protein